MLFYVDFSCEGTDAVRLGHRQVPYAGGAGTEIHHQLTAIYKNVYEECNVQNPHGLLHRGCPRACYRL